MFDCLMWFSFSAKLHIRWHMPSVVPRRWRWRWRWSIDWFTIGFAPSITGTISLKDSLESATDRTARLHFPQIECYQVRVPQGRIFILFVYEQLDSHYIAITNNNKYQANTISRNVVRLLMDDDDCYWFILSSTYTSASKMYLFEDCIRAYLRNKSSREANKYCDSMSARARKRSKYLTLNFVMSPTINFNCICAHSK